MQEINAAGLYELLKPQVVLNVGAFDCEDAYVFAKSGCEVHAFEPMDIPMRTHDNIKVYQIALSNEDKFTKFYVSDNKCSGSLRKPKNHLTIWPRVEFTHNISVECVKLDTWNKLPEIDLIFADVNGAEREFIEGAAETLKRTKYLFIEASDKELYEGQSTVQQVIDMLPGFTLMGVYNDYERFCDLLFKNEEFPIHEQYRHNRERDN